MTTMRWKVKQCLKSSNLHVRSGPSTSYKILRKIAPGTVFYVDQKKVSNGWTWLKHEGKNEWSCMREKGVKYDYIKLLEDLSEKKPTVTPVKKKEPVVKTPAPDTTPKFESIGENKLSGDRFGKSGNDIKWHERVNTLDEEKGSSGVNSKSRSVYSRAVSYSYTNSKLASDMKKIRENLDMSYRKTNGDFYGSLMPELFKNFNRFKVTFPDYHLHKTFAYVFFTRPDLNIVNKNKTMTSPASSDELYNYIWANNKDIILSLTQFFDSSHQFNTFLSNVAGSFEVSDEFIKPAEHGETFTGNKIQYGKSDIESRAAGEFSVKYIDDANLSIYKMHKIWVDYISKVYRGEFYPRIDYMLQKVLDYACSAYYFLCGPDGETILFWSKYIGVFPTNIPSSTLSWSRDSVLSKPEMSINYSYSFKEDFDPIALVEFNELSTPEAKNRKARAMYDESHGSMGSTFVGTPYIVRDTIGSRTIFKLKWNNTKIYK